jgi:outer membrane exchange protein TraA
MHWRPFLRVSLFVLSALSVCLASALARAQSVVVTGSPVASLPPQPGFGLCSASSSSQNPANDFPQSAASYNAGINAFLEAQQGSRIHSVIQTSLDLSNNNSAGAQASFGDFTNAVPNCPAGGCGFAYNDTTTAFATRLRGFLAVSSDMVAVPLHFGFYADDSVSMTLFDREGRSYPVVTRPPALGFPTWRVTNTVVFQQQGLYPVEVLYTQIAEHAALEMSVFQGTFTDFERPANQVPIVSLASAGFTLVTPAMFHHAETGLPSFPPDATQCMQCGRQFAGSPGSSGCSPGSHCNAAALCSTCNTEMFCGSSCQPCQLASPYCLNRNGNFECVQCRLDADCPQPAVCQVAGCTTANTCAVSNVPDGTGCPGGACESGTCVPFDAGTPDAGSSPADGGGTAADAGPNPGGPDGSVPGTDAGASEPDAGGPLSDAGSRPDSGTGSGSDGGASSGSDGGPGPDGGAGPGGGTDGGAPPDGPDEDSGCGCGSGGSSMAALALLGLVLLTRRARRARRDDADSVGSGVA